MGWVWRSSPANEHRCDLPAREAVTEQPASPSAPDTTRFELHEKEPIGRVGDLYRCDDCRTVWRIGFACDACDHYGSSLNPHRGLCTIGYKWRPATLIQRLIYR